MIFRFSHDTTAALDAFYDDTAADIGDDTADDIFEDSAAEIFLVMTQQQRPMLRVTICMAVQLVKRRG